MPYNPKLKERQGISTDERRAKVIAETWAILNAKSYNREDFERKWTKVSC